jgi:hypothetical protein
VFTERTSVGGSSARRADAAELAGTGAVILPPAPSGSPSEHDRARCAGSVRSTGRCTVSKATPS